MRSYPPVVMLAALAGSAVSFMCLGVNCQLSDVLAFQSSVSGGQQAPAQVPLAVTCPGLDHACTFTDSAEVMLTAHVTRTAVTALTVTWSIDNTVVDTQSLPDT